VGRSLGSVVLLSICQIEELKTTPREPTESAPVLAAQALDQELNGSRSLSVSDQSNINDLTMIVKKKKKCAEDDEKMKRKANHEMDGPLSEKKVKRES
jgi:HAT1-interacting factor 1